MAKTYNDSDKVTAALALGGIGAVSGAILGVGVAGSHVGFVSAIIGAIGGGILAAWLERS